MSKCTATEALKAFEYWLGYHEKASKEYSETRDKTAFDKNAGSANYTYAGYLCGVNPGAWCAMMVSTAIYDACNSDKDGAKSVLYGVWPYLSCDQVYDAAPASMRWRRGYGEPKPGDIIVFGNSTRDHTGLVYSVTEKYVYTMEGNSSNKCQKRSYLKTDSWIWGYIRPCYSEDGNGNYTYIKKEQYGKTVCNDPVLHLLSKGCAGPEVKTVQRILFAAGFVGEDNEYLTLDGAFGKNTKYAVMEMQKKCNIESDGIVGAETWNKLLKEL